MNVQRLIIATVAVKGVFRRYAQLSDEDKAEVIKRVKERLKENSGPTDSVLPEDTPDTVLDTEDTDPDETPEEEAEPPATPEPPAETPEETPPESEPSEGDKVTPVVDGLIKEVATIKEDGKVEESEVLGLFDNMMKMVTTLIKTQAPKVAGKGRGNQVRRKDKDLMSDTGGSSKGRDREPHKKPPRDDVKKRHREKRKTRDEKDKDTQSDPDMKQGSEIREMVNRVAESYIASLAEKEVEKLFKKVLPKSPFRNKAFAVGGYVRDEIMGIDSKDLDVVVEMKGGAKKITHWIHRQFPQATSRPHQLGRGYPIWSITFKEHVTHDGKVYRTKGAVIEFADSQSEAFPDPESRQRVTRPGTIEQDVERRDFTVNMLLKDLSSGELKDLTGTSVQDIKKGILRGHPGVDLNDTFRDDPLRMIRLVRFQAKYGWQVPLEVIKIVRKNAQRIKIVSGERVRDELVKLMEIGKLKQGIRMMKTLGLLKYVLPEIAEMEKVMHDTTRGHHQEGSVYKHTLLVLQNAKPGVVNQLAALLHDVGKPKTQEILTDKITFIGHDKVGAEIAEAIMRRLKFEGKVIRKVKHMVQHHMRPHGLVFGKEPASKKALRKFVRTVGEEMVESILDLAEADQLGNLPPKNLIPDLRKSIEEAMKIPISDKPVLDGREVMKLLDIKPGPMIGKAMAFLKDKADEYAERGKVLTKKDAEKLLLEEFA